MTTLEDMEIADEYEQVTLPEKFYRIPKFTVPQKDTYLQRLRDRFFSLYGNKCACCGEKRREFLTIEHKKGNKSGVAGTRDTTTTKAYRRAARFYSPDLYEVLCMNCNHARGRYGYCPHQN